MPGSPPKSISAPGTMPPPNTRSISPKVVDIRAIEEISISGKAVGFVDWFPTPREGVRLCLVSLMISSTNVFHSPHCGQRPIHLEDSAPQF